MTTVFLVTFFVGFSLTLVSALLGAVDTGAGHGHGGDFGHGHGGDLAHGSPGADSGGHTGHGGPHDSGSVSAVNFQTIVAFLMGFGGIGYLATRFGYILMLLAIPLALVGGVAIAGFIYRFMRLLKRGEVPMAPSSYVGLVGRLTVAIRLGGTGELVYTQNGSRKVMAARSAAGTAISNGEEVVVLRYEQGVVYVQPWREFKDQEHL